jgi:hypothetical protein
MTPQETGAVLAKMAVYDQRNVSPTDVMAWHEVIGHLELQDCLTAVTTHYRESSQRAMPADIRRLAISVRDQRKAGQTVRALPAGPTVRDRSPEVTALIRQVLERLPSTDLLDRARDRARRERGRPPLELRRDRRPPGKKPRDYPAPATDQAAALATRYLLDGYEPADVADRFAVSRKWCHRTARRLTHRQPTTEE